MAMTTTTTTMMRSSSSKLAQVPERFVKNHVKTRMCSFFLQKKCLRGNSCKFAHSQHELRSAPDYTKTRFCEVFFQTGACSSKETCLFAHSQEELRVRDPRKMPHFPPGRPIETQPDDIDSEDDEPLVTKNLTASTTCTIGSRGCRRWADVMDDDDVEDDFGEFDSWSSTGIGSFTSGFSSPPSCTLDFEETKTAATATKFRPKVEEAEEAEEREEREEEFDVECIIKNSFFHLQPAAPAASIVRSTSSGGSRVRSSSAFAVLKR